jgi:hypothetical protein
MCKSFALWRLPPVLIVQLKRFQFDHTSRRKLNNHIDFPFEDLDLFDYLAGTRKRSLSTVSQADLGAGDSASPAEEGGDSDKSAEERGSAALAMAALYGDSSDAADAARENSGESVAFAGASTEEAPCTRYDLYSVIHHAGALGGGHYATTARTLSARTSAGTSQSSHSSANNGNGSGGDNAGETLDAGAWYWFNDNLVSKISDPRSDVCNASAYVLFYLRQDMRRGDVLALLRSQLAIPAVTPSAPATVDSPAEEPFPLDLPPPPAAAPTATVIEPLVPSPEDALRQTGPLLPAVDAIQPKSAKIATDRAAPAPSGSAAAKATSAGDRPEPPRVVKKKIDAYVLPMAAQAEVSESAGGGCVPS